MSANIYTSTPLTTPTRRSKRYQVYAADLNATDLDEYSYTWLGPIWHSRPTSYEDDLHPLEIEAINSSKVLQGNFNFDSDIMRTNFYEAFSRTKKPQTALSRGKRQKLNHETFSVGDTVFVKSQTGVPNVAVIMSLWNTEIINEHSLQNLKHSGMKIQVQWFMRPHQCAMVRKHRKFYQTELYFTTNQTATLYPSSVIEHCVVSNVSDSDTSDLVEMHPEHSSKPSPTIKDFCCRFALHSGRGKYYELNWEKHRQTALSISRSTHKAKTAWRVDDGNIAVQGVKGEKYRSPSPFLDDRSESDNGDVEQISDYECDERGRKGEPSGSDQSPTEDDGGDDYAKPQKLFSKGKGRSNSTLGLTNKRRGPMLTYKSKMAVGTQKKRKVGRDFSLKLPFPRSATDYVRLENLPSDPYLRAMRLLHVGARPDALPCREDEYMDVMSAILSLLEENGGGCIYISGVPGTGKTATVHNVVRDLKSMARRSEVNPFTYVEINGLRVSEPSNAYSLLWEAISGHNAEVDGRLAIRPKEALRKLNQYFTAGVQAGPGSHACIVLMDELDQLVTPKQEIIYNFFNWPNLSNSKLIVIAVANTHDLPERVMSGKVRSRLGMVRINFHPYTRDQLHKIVESRLTTAKIGLQAEDIVDIFEQDAIKFAAMKISAVSGDARRVLDVCRRAVELIQLANETTVRILHVKQVIDSMQNSPTSAFLRDCSLHERILLGALLRCIKRTGVDEIPWSEVTHQHLLYMNTLTDSKDPPKWKPTVVELSHVLDSLVASGAVIFEMATNLKKNSTSRKVMLNLEASEVERVLGEVGGTSWKNALGM